LGGAGKQAVVPRTFLHFLKKLPLSKWDQASPAQKYQRALFWLAAQRNSLAPERRDDWREVFDDLSLRMKRSFAKTPAGTPASGFGDPNDNGWLSTVLRVLEEVSAAPSLAPRIGELPPWSQVVAAWINSSFLTGGFSQEPSWWTFGGVAGTFKNKRMPGDPGWETEGMLPGDPQWAAGMGGKILRPSQLEHRWESMVTMLMNTMADLMAQEEDWDVGRCLRIDDLLAGGQPEAARWLSQPLAFSLLRVAKVGLLGVPAETIPAAARYDGRSVSTLEWLVTAKPPLDWFPLEDQCLLARAIVSHQRSWSQSSQPLERRMALEKGSLGRSHGVLVEWANALIVELGIPQSPRRPRMG